MATELDALSGDVAGLIDYRRHEGGMSYAPARRQLGSTYIAITCSVRGASGDELTPWRNPWVPFDQIPGAATGSDHHRANPVHAAPDRPLRNRCHAMRTLLARVRGPRPHHPVRTTEGNE